MPYTLYQYPGYSHALPPKPEQGEEAQTTEGRARATSVSAAARVRFIVVAFTRGCASSDYQTNPPNRPGNLIFADRADSWGECA